MWNPTDQTIFLRTNASPSGHLYPPRYHHFTYVFHFYSYSRRPCVVLTRPDVNPPELNWFKLIRINCKDRLRGVTEICWFYRWNNYTSQRYSQIFIIDPKVKKLHIHVIIHFFYTFRWQFTVTFSHAVSIKFNPAHTLLTFFNTAI